MALHRFYRGQMTQECWEDFWSYLSQGFPHTFILISNGIVMKGAEMKLLKKGPETITATTVGHPEVRFTPLGECVITLYLLTDNGLPITATSKPMIDSPATTEKILEDMWPLEKKWTIEGEWIIWRNHSRYEWTKAEECR